MAPAPMIGEEALVAADQPAFDEFPGKFHFAIQSWR
jgi:hypothetical protein